MRSEKQLLKALRRSQERIAKERDVLLNLQDEITDVLDDCEEGLQSLDMALDYFSRQQ